MKTMMLALCVVLAGSIVHEARADRWTYEMVASNETPFLGQGWFKVRHTWSDVFSFQDNHDATQSWMSGIGRCDRSGVNGCRSAYRSWAYSHSLAYSSTTKSTDFYLNHHNWDNAVDRMTYLVNGVCHTATNRASRKSGLKRTVDYHILGTSASQSAWGTCGKYSPWGYGISCP